MNEFVFTHMKLSNVLKSISKGIKHIFSPTSDLDAAMDKLGLEPEIVRS